MSSDNKEESNSSQPEIIEVNAAKDEDSKPMDESSVDSDIKEIKPDNESKSNKKDSDVEEMDKDSDNEEVKKDDVSKDVKESDGDSDVEENKKIIGVKNGNVRNKSEDESEKEVSEKESVHGSDKESEKDNEKDSDEDEDDKEMGLLDRPVEVTGCRARKKVQRLEIAFTPKKDKKEIPEGKGQKLGDCPRIEYQITKFPVAHMKILHRIIFNRPGNVHETKKNVRKFSGFPFEKNSAEYDQKKSHLEKLKLSDLKKICNILDLEVGGVKDDVVVRVLEFLMEPKDSGKKVPQKKSGGRAKKKSEKKTKNNKTKSKATADSDEEEEEDDDNVPSSSEASDKADEEDEESDHDVKKSKSTGKKTPAKAKATKKTPKKEKTPAKKAKTNKRESVKGTKRKRDVVSDDSSEDEEPVAKKSNMPSDDDITALVKKILDKADLQEITMKKVIKQVFDTYPECDLAHKKGFIKATIKSVIE